MHYNYVNSLLQHTIATYYCNTRLLSRKILLLRTTATYYCNTLLHSSNQGRIMHRSYVSTLLQHNTATHYCNILLQHTTATHYCNILLLSSNQGRNMLKLLHMYLYYQRVIPKSYE